MNFSIWAGNIYCGELVVVGRWHEFTSPSGGQAVSYNQPIERLLYYKRLRLVRWS